jgi:hypothetical protein
MLVRSPATTILISPDAAQLRLSPRRLKRKATNAEQERIAAKMRKRRSRGLKQKLKKSLLSLRINRDWLIDAAVERGLLTEKDVAENAGKRQAVLNALQAEIEGVVVDKVRSWRRQK